MQFGAWQCDQIWLCKIAKFGWKIGPLKTFEIIKALETSHDFYSYFKVCNSLIWGQTHLCVVKNVLGKILEALGTFSVQSLGHAGAS